MGNTLQFSDFATDPGMLFTVGSGLYVVYQFIQDFDGNRDDSFKKMSLRGMVLFLLLCLIAWAGASRYNDVAEGVAQKNFREATSVKLGEYNTKFQASVEVLESLDSSANVLKDSLDSIGGRIAGLSNQLDKYAKDLNTLSQLTEKQVQIAQSEFKAGKPVFVIAPSKIEVSPIDGNDRIAGIYFYAKNNGGRTAIDVQIKTLALLSQTIPKDGDYIRATRSRNASSNPYVPVGRQVEAISTQIDTAEWSKYKSCLLVVHISFVDIGTNLKDSVLHVVRYNGNAKDPANQWYDYDYGPTLAIYRRRLRLTGLEEFYSALE